MAVSAGDNTGCPAAAERIPASDCSLGASVSRYLVAAARSWESCPHPTRTSSARTPGNAACGGRSRRSPRPRRHPASAGPSTHIGIEPFDQLDPGFPVRRLTPTRSNSAPENMPRRPFRTTGWSSTTTTRITPPPSAFADVRLDRGQPYRHSGAAAALGLAKRSVTARSCQGVRVARAGPSAPGGTKRWRTSRRRRHLSPVALVQVRDLDRWCSHVHQTVGRCRPASVPQVDSDRSTDDSRINQSVDAARHRSTPSTS